jgi:hypothetical protein
MLEKLTTLALPALALLTIAGTIWGAWPERKPKASRDEMKKQRRR